MKIRIKISVWLVFFFSISSIYAQQPDYYKNGEGITSGGKKIGKWEFFHDNGNLSAEGQYKDGKNEGEWRYYDENGVLTVIANFKEDQLNGLFTIIDDYYSSKIITNMKNGVEHGWKYTISYDELSYVDVYENGIRLLSYEFGKDSYWFPDSFEKLIDIENRTIISVGKKNEKNERIGVWKHYLSAVSRPIDWNINNIEELVLIGESSEYADKLYSKGFLVYEGFYFDDEVDSYQEKINFVSKYDRLYGVSKDLAVVMQNNKWGIINATGKLMVPLKYDYIHNQPFEGLYWTQLNDKNGFININDEEIIPIKYENEMYFHESLGIALISVNGKYGYVNTKGEEFIPPIYEDFATGGQLKEGMIPPMKLKGKWGFVDNNGKEYIPFIYDNAISFIEGLAWVNLGGEFIDSSSWKFDGGKWGAIDRSGDIIIPFKYDKVRPFSEGLAAVKLNEKWGMIDKNGKEIILFNYDDIYDFEEGKVWVKLNGREFYIDKNGNEIKE